MARKSRKNMMPQAAVQEAVQQNEKELLRTAAYARLSVENGGHETEDSLHTQILQIHNYILYQGKPRTDADRYLCRQWFYGNTF